ncbi:MAG: SIR2 family NAD-dependent protein deacylase [Bacteroidia bacterium]
MKKIVVFTGAGISAESGIKTFRDSNGLWEEYDISEVATPEAWFKNPALVLDFYNKRRKQVMEAQPNAAHLALVKLEKYFDVQIITQNIDDLHERAGSKNVLHLHGEIMKARSTASDKLIYPVKNGVISMGEKCEKGFQLRPHVVWFGEEVPNMEIAYEIASKADIFITIGTSLSVYPAAGLIHFTPQNCKIYLIDPNAKNIDTLKNLEIINEKAGTGVPALVERLISSKKLL